MTDIVDRLRKHDLNVCPDWMDKHDEGVWIDEADALLSEAASEIVSLRRQLEEARNKALEEAAAAADGYECSLADYGGSVDAQRFYEAGMLDAGQGIASAIRSLKDNQP